jgi:hypothetical protein
VWSVDLRTKSGNWEIFSQGYKTRADAWSQELRHVPEVAMATSTTRLSRARSNGSRCSRTPLA